MMRRTFAPGALICLLALSGLLNVRVAIEQEPDRVPVVYSTDLFHPPGDPDDHVDLATLFALPELDIRAIVHDQGETQEFKPGQIPLSQMMALTGRKVPFAPGLVNPLRYPEDTATNQFRFFQSGVELILRTLQESEQRVFIITTGSVRDLMAAFNRAPQLFRDKVDRIYVNAGNSVGGELYWNPSLDPQAYLRLMRSDLPICWCPCFGGKENIETLIAEQLKVQQYQTYWKFRQAEIFGALPQPLQNFFLYALGRKISAQVDPIAFLKRTPEQSLRAKEWKQFRNMWSTASLYHAAGRQLYRKNNSWAALRAPEPGYTLSEVFDFIPASISIDADLRSTLDFSRPPGSFKVFHLRDIENYQRAMLTSLRQLLSEMPLTADFQKQPRAAESTRR